MNVDAVNNLVGLQWHEDGYAALSGDLLAWAKSLDAHIRGWAEELGAADYRFPSLIAARALAPVAYLRSFPHLATFVTSSDRHAASLRSLADKSGDANTIAVRDDQFEPIEHLLTPAACYHFYPRFAGNRLDQPLFLTTRCQCFRREEHYLPLQRQWCFDMRELVCIGDKESIEQFTTQCAIRIGRLLSELDIDASWQTATDPFFDPQADPKALAQILEPSKRELCTTDGLAIGSINKHRSFFGESYDIRLRNAVAHSACVAFGSERWLYAMVARHGNDVAAWPQPGAER